MPRVGQPTRSQLIEAVWRQFESGFQRSKSNPANVWQDYEGLRVTVYRRNDGFYGWCIADADDGRRFSTLPYETQDEAITALGVEVIVI